MIKLENTKSLFEIESNEKQQNKKNILIKKAVKLKPNEIQTINTGIFIEEIDESDECWIKGGIEDGIYNVLMLSERYTNEEVKSEIVLTFYNTNENEIILPKDLSIARIYYSITNNGAFNEKELYATNVYNDGDLVVKCISNEEHHFEIITDSEGKRTLSIDMKD